MSTEKEHETLLELKSGNLVAFEKILFVYENKILNYIYRFVRRREDAEDLTQETFIRFYKNIEDIDPDNNFKGWLYKIATNIVFDWLRKEKRIRDGRAETKSVEPEFLMETQSSSEYRVHVLGQIENTDEVKRAMSELHPMHQSILILFYWDEFSQPEIAKLWNIPLGTVKTRMRQARQELKKVILEKNNHSEIIPKEYGLSLSKN